MEKRNVEDSPIEQPKAEKRYQWLGEPNSHKDYIRIEENPKDFPILMSVHLEPAPGTEHWVRDERASPRLNQPLERVKLHKIHQDLSSEKDEIQSVIDYLREKEILSENDKKRLEIILNVTKDIKVLCKEGVENVVYDISHFYKTLKEKWEKAIQELNDLNKKVDENEYLTLEVMKELKKMISEVLLKELKREKLEENTRLKRNESETSKRELEEKPECKEPVKEDSETSKHLENKESEAEEFIETPEWKEPVKENSETSKHLEKKESEVEELEKEKVECKEPAMEETEDSALERKITEIIKKVLKNLEAESKKHSKSLENLLF